MVPFLLWHKSVITPDLLRAVHELPGSPGARRARAVVEHTRKPGLRGRSLRRSPLGSRAPRGEDTSEPVPHPCRGASGGVRSADATLQGASLKLRHPKSSHAPQGAKQLQKSKKPTCRGVGRSPKTEACLPVTAYRREAGSPFC